jgi:hypothetical protein
VGPSSKPGKQGIHQTTSAGKTVAQFLGDVRIVNDFASELVGLSSASIDQGSKNYSTHTLYSIEFTPTSVPDYSVNILLTFPTTIEPTDVNPKTGEKYPCIVQCRPAFTSDP